jgi:ribosome-associated translation inhibitor RaiA
MPLPKIATPSYELELPSTGKTIQYRPFLVKEEKLLVIALESEDIKQITNAIKAVIRSCILKVEKSDDHTNQIKLDTNLMMELKYPSLNEFIKNNFDPNDTSKNPMEQSFDLVGSCIDKIYNEDEVWVAADCTKKEITDFLDSMNSNQFKEVENFFETMPKLSHTVKVVNPKTKVESDIVLEGLASFFG